MGETDKQIINQEVSKLSFADKVDRGLAIAGSVLSMAWGAMVHEAVFTPAKASGTMECTTVVTDGAESETCTSDGSSSQPDKSEEASTEPDKPPGNNHKPEAEKQQQHREEEREARQEAKEKRANSQKGFPGYDMEDSTFTDEDGCFITSVASSFRRETGDANIKPRTIYYPELREMWKPGIGVIEDLLFTALDEMAARHNMKVWHTDDFEKALEAKKNGDEVIIRAGAGHFTGGGHYMAARGVTRDGKRIIIDDPNAKGRYGDSERKNGWNGGQLKAGGVLDYHIMHLRGVA